MVQTSNEVNDLLGFEKDSSLEKVFGKSSYAMYFVLLLISFVGNIALWS